MAEHLKGMDGLRVGDRVIPFDELERLCRKGSASFDGKSALVQQLIREWGPDWMKHG